MHSQAEFRKRCSFQKILVVRDEPVLVDKEISPACLPIRSAFFLNGRNAGLTPQSLHGVQQTTLCLRMRWIRTLLATRFNRVVFLDCTTLASSWLARRDPRLWDPSCCACLPDAAVLRSGS